jgi:hypothetical protein
MKQGRRMRKGRGVIRRRPFKLCDAIGSDEADQDGAEKEKDCTCR